MVMSNASVAHRYGRLPDPEFSPGNTALLIVDMQYLDADPAYGLVARLRDQGLMDAYAYNAERLKVIVPNIQRLLKAFRGARMEIIYTVIESLTRNGRDRSLEHKRLNILAPPGSKEAQVLEALAPGADEIVLKKTCGNVFSGTNVHYVLGNLGIRILVICGVITGGCVESAVRGASSLSYEVVVPEDACATWTADMQATSISTMQDIYAKVYTTEEIIRRLGAMTLPQSSAQSHRAST
jgi:nicotinamidase-related amidase